MAVAKEKEEERKAKEKADEAIARRAKLPKRPKEPIPLWMGRFEETLRRNEALAEEDEVFDLEFNDVDLPPDGNGGLEGEADAERRETEEVYELLTAEYGSYIHADLIQGSAEILVARNVGGQVQE